MASYRKRMVDGKARWDVTVTRVGAPRQSRTFQTKSAAESWARDVERDVERGAWRSTDLAERMTVADLLQRYAEEVLPTKKSGKLAQQLALRLTGHEELARLPLLALTPEYIARFRDKRLRARASTGGGRQVQLKRVISSQTVRHELNMLQRAITHATREWGLHLPAGNPVALVKLPSPSRARNRRTSESEYRALLQEAYRCRAPFLGHAIEFAVETAMRRGEICRLTWSDIDFDRRVATANETKNGDPRDVPLSSRALQVLRSIPRPIHGGRVFQLSEGGFSQAFRRLCDRLDIQNLHLHDLGHEATTRLAVRLNGDVMALSAITGHKTLQMLKRYTHLRAEDLARRIA